jgi:Bacterial signalling protein N terminal repeat
MSIDLGLSEIIAICSAGAALWAAFERRRLRLRVEKLLKHFGI